MEEHHHTGSNRYCSAMSYQKCGKDVDRDDAILCKRCRLFAQEKFIVMSFNEMVKASQRLERWGRRRYENINFNRRITKIG